MTAPTAHPEGRTTVIAEIGECFNGCMETARALIIAARDAGCDYAKFQTLDAENIADDDPERDWFLKVALDPDRIAQIMRWCRELGIAPLFTPENAKTAGWLLAAGMREAKIASSCIADEALIDCLAERFDAVFMSTGMATLEEVDAAVSRLEGRCRLAILHCVSEYPTGPLLHERGLRALAPEDARLNMMRILQTLYPRHAVGYSDHTDGLAAPVAAVAMGAQVIEKHITLDRRTPVANFARGGEYLGTDHVLSLEPAELVEMVRRIREIEALRGPWRWERSAGERVLRRFLRERFASGSERAP